MKRDRLTFDLPQVLTPAVLMGGLFAVMLAAITDSDGWMHGAGVCLVVDALLVQVSKGLREG